MASLCGASGVHLRHQYRPDVGNLSAWSAHRHVQHGRSCCHTRDVATARHVLYSIAGHAGNLDDSCWPEHSSASEADLERIRSSAAASTSPQCAAQQQEQQQQQQQQQQEQQQQQHPLVAPWGAGKTVQVVGLWLLAYFATGQLLVPFVLSLLGIDRGDLSFPDKAILHLLLDLWELAVTVAVLWRCLGKFQPRQKGFFPFRWEGARWLPWVLVGMLSFPLVDWLAHESLIWVNGPDGYAELGYAELEATLHSGDWGTVLAYLVVVAACAPAWEELIFRGFLLVSLSKYLPGSWAVVSNSLLFALCHFRLETLAPLFVLGLVFGGVYVRTNNLVPSILLHSLWNVYVVATMVLRSYGWKWWWVPSAMC